MNKQYFYLSNNSKSDNSDSSLMNNLEVKDFLPSIHNISFNSVNKPVRNANLQLRSDPPNPKMEVGPWNLSTISGDPYRRPLELGSA